MKEKALIDHLESLASIDADGIPLLAAVPRKDWPRGLRVWCRHCKRWHVHGEGYGHRVAHCPNPDIDHIGAVKGAPKSPYSKTGYYLTDPATLKASRGTGGCKTTE